MLTSILGTLAPTIGHLRPDRWLCDVKLFSIRRWVRSGASSLWMPYIGNHVAALRGLNSGWMNIAIMETLSLKLSFERRIWFHVDELDALGRIEALKYAQARLRKFRWQHCDRISIVRSGQAGLWERRADDHRELRESSLATRGILRSRRPN